MLMTDLLQQQWHPMILKTLEIILSPKYFWTSHMPLNQHLKQQNYPSLNIYKILIDDMNILI